MEKADGFRIVIIAYIIVFGAILAGVAFGACNLMGICNSENNLVRIVFFDSEIDLELKDYVLVNGKIGIVENIISANDSNCKVALVYKPPESQMEKHNIASYEISSRFEIAQINFDSKQKNFNSGIEHDLNNNNNGGTNSDPKNDCDRLMENKDEIPTIFAKRTPEKVPKKGDHKYKTIDFYLHTALDPIIAKNEPQISSMIGNAARYTGALAINEEKSYELIEKKIEATEAITSLTQTTEKLVNTIESSVVKSIFGNLDTFTGALAANEVKTNELIEKKIDATEKIAELASKSGSFVSTSEKLIKDIDPDDVRQIVVNSRHITGRFKTLLSEFNVSLELANRLLKHIEPLAISKFFKNIAEIRSTLEIQSRDVQDIKHDVRDISEEVENFVQIFTHESREIRQIIIEMQQSTEKIETYTKSLPEIKEKISKLLFLLKKVPSDEKICCPLKIDGLDMNEVNNLIFNLKILSAEVGTYTARKSKLIDKNEDEIFSLLRKLDEFFGTGIDSLLQLEEEKGNSKQKHHK